MTDSESDRITRLETRLDGLRDVLERDLRAVFPLVRENGEMRKTLEHVEGDVRELRTSFTDAVREVRQGLEDLKEQQIRDEKERQRVREEREEKEREAEARAKKDREERAATERRDRWARWLPTVAVIVAIVVGVVDQL